MEKATKMRSGKFLAGLTVALLGSTAHATVTYTLENAGIHSTQVAGATTVNFNDGTCGAYAPCTGNWAAIVEGSAAGLYATPYGIDDRYLTVGQNGSVSLGLSSSYDYFGLYWGSADTYNHLSFYLNDTLVGSFSGDELAPLMASGNQTSYSSNRFVNFLFSGGDRFNRVTLRSDGYAFETDNHAFGNVTSVPEPATALLLAVGGIPLLLRKRRAAARNKA
jgi:hypothetical protein